MFLDTTRTPWSNLTIQSPDRRNLSYVPYVLRPADLRDFIIGSAIVTALAVLTQGSFRDEQYCPYTLALFILVAPALFGAIYQGWVNQCYEQFLSVAEEKLEVALGENRQKANNLEEKQFKLDVALNNMLRGISMFDADHKLVMCNKYYQDVYDLPDALTQSGTSFFDIISYYLANQGQQNSAHAQSVTERWLIEHKSRLEKGEPYSEVQHLQHGRIIEICFQPLAGGGWVDTQEDITEKHGAEARINYLAHYDTTSGLPNRNSLKNHLDQLLPTARSGHSFAILILDLDGFKAINDTMGHNAGDQLLRQVANRLKELTGEGEFVARMGGDEFALIKSNVTTVLEINTLADHLISAISEPYRVCNQWVRVGASVGASLAVRDGNDADTLMANADLALYRSKRNGRGRFSMFDKRMSEEAQERYETDRNLRTALANDDFEIYYQPIVETDHNSVVGFEALIRWNHAEKGVISPARFIPLAEETGTIVQIGNWVLETACAQAAQWPKKFKVAVNVSPTQLQQPSFITTVADALKKSGLSPARLEIEITESMAAEATDNLLNNLIQLREIGVSIAVDDFGTGYSSLSALHKLPINKVKIDRSFIRDLDRNKHTIAFMRAISTLGRALDLTVCVEGIETIEQLEVIRNEQCHQYQGYLLSPPLPSAEIKEKFLRNAA